MFHSLLSRFSKPVPQVLSQLRPCPVLNHSLMKVPAKIDVVLSIPAQAVIVAVDQGYDPEPMLRLGCFPPDCKQLDLRGVACGFEAASVSGLTHLWIDQVRPSMKFPAGLNLFITRAGPNISRRLWQLKYSGCNLFLNKEQFETYDQLDLPEHHTFSTSKFELDRHDITKAFGCLFDITKHTPKKVKNLKE